MTEPTFSTPEAQRHFDIQKATQEALQERDQKAMLDLQTRAAEIADSYAKDREKAAKDAAKSFDDLKDEKAALADRIGDDDTKVIDHAEPEAPDRVVDKGGPLDPAHVDEPVDVSKDNKPPANKTTNGAPKGSDVAPSDKKRA